jgi:hypothetical protein
MATIYAFINTKSADFLVVIAVHPDGRVLAGHASSSVEWAKHDIGATSAAKHDLYSTACPDGFVVEWVDEPTTHPGVSAALAAAKAREANRLAEVQS